MRPRGKTSAAAVIATLALASCGGTPAPEVTGAQVRALMAQPCPGELPVGTGGATERRLQASRTGKFKVLGKPVKLRAPVDWKLDPYHSDSWRSKLQSWGWMGPLITRAHAGDMAGVRQSRDLALDWIKGNPPGDGDGWKNKVTGNRAVYLAYVTRAAACRRSLSEAQARTLLASAISHGRYLAKQKTDRFGNHGLFAAEGLLVLSGYLPFLADSPRWHRLAGQRIANGLSRQVQPKEGVDLEHSPGYHFLVINLVSQFMRIPGQASPSLRALDERMRRVAPWFVMPDGYITRLGDTARKPAPPWAKRLAARYHGLSPTRRSGFAIVKAPGAYLSVAAGYHPGAVHKQADELTFELYDRGHHVVTDTGRYGAARSKGDRSKQAGLAFTKSSQAHSVLLVDDQSFPFAKYKPYGSAIEAVGQGAGWYAIEASNPLVARQQVEHRRLFLYRPGVALVVVDLVRSGAQHTYTRQFQFDPGLRVQRQGRAFRLSAKGFSGWLTDARAPGDQAPTLVRGRRSPLLGWTTSEDKFVPFIARSAVQYPSRAASARYVATIGLRGRASATVSSADQAAIVVRLRVAGQSPLTLKVARSGDRLSVSRSG